MPAIQHHLTDGEILLELGSRLRMRRLDRGITAEQAAERTGMDRKTILAAESGQDVKLSTLVKLLRLMDMLGVLDAVVPDTLPMTFTSRGRVRQRAAAPRRRKDKS